MTDRFPIPLNALHAIEIVARTGALKPAADELGVTIGAVSQHIRRAEARLGVELFERSASGMKPSPTLEQVRPLLSAGFANLADATRDLQRPGDAILTLTLGSVFASRWLIRRLPQFTALHPEIELRIVATGKLVDLARSDIDCAIRYGDGRWPNVNAEPLHCTSFSPVVAPDFPHQLERPSDLGHVPVVDDAATMLSWPHWFEAAGEPMPHLAGPRYSDPILAYDAAFAGQAVLLAVDRMTEQAVRDGWLIRPFEFSAVTGLDYWFVTSTARRQPRKVQQFREWLLGAMGV
ncbi:MAG: LysR family transcriptional regulator [Hyphomicrobiales bacterium]|nr:MAG: LysR family transcriptional regulator [Hyphomicrobiales bacterium]